MSEAAADVVPDLHARAGKLAAGLAARLEAERDRWALWIPVGFATGVGMATLLFGGPFLDAG